MNILIGGAAGQGMDTIAHILGKTLARSGFGVLAAKDYMSRVRGGHNFTRLRVADSTPAAAEAAIHLLVALNEETLSLHRSCLTDNGRIIYDPQHVTLSEALPGAVPVELEALAKQSGGAIMANTVAVGAALALLGRQTDVAESVLAEIFSGETGKQNIVALHAGHAAASQYCDGCLSLPQVSGEDGPSLYLDGNQTLGMAALASGCNFLSAYPMTPATGVMAYLAGKQLEHSLLVEQAEDEIAAVNMALGASFAGARALTCTSGGGFALMVEGLSLAGMTETPLVIILAMRPGPATGLPTRTEQGDLDFALYAGHGEFPRAVLCATHIKDAFYRLNKAFELADKYQIPVIFLSDQNFADTMQTVPPFDFGKLHYNRCLVTEDTIIRPYQRYRLSENGVSPRALPGIFAGEVVLADSDEHDENGNIIEDGETRKLMADKRLRKLQQLATEMDEPHLSGNDTGDVLLVGWGSTFGALQEACTLLNERGIATSLLHFADLWPLPTAAVSRLFAKFRLRICVENNATGQFAALLRRQTGLVMDRQIRKYDGRPFMAAEIVREVEKYV